jgi:exosome complex RNA-binding protein Csl4
MDGALEQKPRQKSGRAEIEKVKIGDIVRGEEVSGTRKRGKQVLGRVLQVNLQDGGIVSYKIITQRGKEVLLDPSTVTKIDVNGEDPSPMSAPQTQLESYEPVERVLLYEQWKSNQ